MRVRLSDIQMSYEPVAKRHWATCPTCAYVVKRTSREAAMHAMTQHVVYTHDGRA